MKLSQISHYGNVTRTAPNNWGFTAHFHDGTTQRIEGFKSHGDARVERMTRNADLRLKQLGRPVDRHPAVSGTYAEEYPVCPTPRSNPGFRPNYWFD